MFHVNHAYVSLSFAALRAQPSPRARGFRRRRARSRSSARDAVTSSEIEPKRHRPWYTTISLRSISRLRRLAAMDASNLSASSRRVARTSKEAETSDRVKALLLTFLFFVRVLASISCARRENEIVVSHRAPAPASSRHRRSRGRARRDGSARPTSPSAG